MNAHRSSIADAPLRAFGEALRRARARKLLFRRVAIAASVAVSVLGWTAFFPPSPRLIWNASASAPPGLWLVSPGSRILRGDMAIARMPKPWRRFAAARGYLPEQVPLVKRVTAIPGDEICGLGQRIFLNGKPLVARVNRDAKQRWLPWWEGCSRLRKGEYLLLMADNPRSFDGRYFGVTKASEIIGSARLIWAR